VLIRAETVRGAEPTDGERYGAEPTDGELERGILNAVKRGAVDVARTLSARLEERRRARQPGNLVALRRGT